MAYPNIASHLTPPIREILSSYRVHIWYGKTRMAGLQSHEGRMLIDSVVWAQYINVTDTQAPLAPSPLQMPLQRTELGSKNESSRSRCSKANASTEHTDRQHGDRRRVNVLSCNIRGSRRQYTAVTRQGWARMKLLCLKAQLHFIHNITIKKPNSDGGLQHWGYIHGRPAWPQTAYYLTYLIIFYSGYKDF